MLDFLTPAASSPLQQWLEGLEGLFTSHCAAAQLLPGRAGGEQLESRFWPTVRRWGVEPKERRVEPGCGAGPCLPSPAGGLCGGAG